jgi:hypothetical protein
MEFRNGLRACGDQRRHFGPGIRRIFRPASRLTNIDECECSAAFDFVGNFVETWRFLRTSDSNLLAGGSGFAKAFKLASAKLAARNDNGVTADTAHSLSIERDRVFARADQNAARPFGHRLINLFAFPANSGQNAIQLRLNPIPTTSGLVSGLPRL